jgi:hypothetical protein
MLPLLRLLLMLLLLMLLLLSLLLLPLLLLLLLLLLGAWSPAWLIVMHVTGPFPPLCCSRVWSLLLTLTWLMITCLTG